MLVTGTKSKRDTNNDKLTTKPNVRTAFGSTIHLKPKITATTTLTNSTINNQANKNKFKQHATQNNVTNNNKNNKSNKNTNNNNNINSNNKNAKAKYETHIVPTYARPTIATAARCAGAAKSTGPKSLHANIKRVQNLPKGNNMRIVSGLDFLIPKSNTKQRSSRPYERLTGGYASTQSAEYALDFPDNKMDATTQANDREILDHDLMVGDFKIVLPSADVLNRIEQERKENRRQEELMLKRKLDANTEQRSKHLTDLKEFLESGTITRRSMKPTLQNRINNTASKTKNDYSRTGPGTGNKSGKQVHKSSTILSIKSRIKQKENELLSLFDNVSQF